MSKPITPNVLPPHNLLAEEIIIGYLLCNTELEALDLSIINYHLFTLEKHQIIYQVIVEVQNIKQVVDISKIVNKMWKEKTLLHIGGIKSIINIIQKVQCIHIYYDRDIDLKYFIQILNQYYMKRLLVQYSHYIIQLSYLPIISAQEIQKKSKKYINYTIDTCKQKNSKSLDHLISEFMTSLNMSKKEHKNMRISSGFTDLDKMTQGFKAGDLIIIAGRPSMGKTSLAINIANYLIIQMRLSVYIFSLEMSKNEILDKILALNSSIALNKIQNKSIRICDWKNLEAACKVLMRCSLQIDDGECSSINYIESRIQNYIKKTCIVIDYLQLITVNNTKLDNRSQEIGYITRQLKLLAQNRESYIVILSQLNRSIENRANKRPLLSDLRESGCVSWNNLPNVCRNSKNTKHQSFKTLGYEPSYYAIANAKAANLHTESNQYTYSATVNKSSCINTTHNHQLLTEKSWRKQDQIKRQCMHALQANEYSLTASIEFCLLNTIKLVRKTHVYDLKAYEYCNFISGQHIIHNSIEQDADLVLMLYKENGKQNEPRQILDIIVAKHRNGPIGTFRLLFHTDVCKFDNIENKTEDLKLYKLSNN